MTIVEFYDKEALDNAVGTLILRPERTVFLTRGESAEAFKREFSKILAEKGIRTNLITERVSEGRAREKIEECVKKYPDCDFDISGGDDEFLLSVGAAAEKYALALHEADVLGGSVTPRKGGTEYRTYPLELKVRDIIRLHGGRAEEKKALFSWNTTDGGEVAAVWKICAEDCAAWNLAIGAHGGSGRDGRVGAAMVWQKLRREGIVKKGKVAISFRSNLSEYLLQKQGTALEMFAFEAAKSAMRDGKRFFDDGDSGVVIGWKDGKCVENEIDVLLSRGAQSYFISCKNGTVTSEELYKLSTVAARFGGKYSKRALLLSWFEPDKSFMDRAGEMGITVIKNVRYLKKKDLARKLTEI